MKIVKEYIENMNTDVIVNAANGIGYMGGLIGRFIKSKGVAESLHYATKGEIEREARQKCMKSNHLPRYFCGHTRGEVYITSSGCLPSKYVFHAVTMPYPGMRTSLETVDLLLDRIIAEGRRLQIRSLAIPLLGTGTGKLKREEVLALYERKLSSLTDFDIYIVSP